jgi:hypothetical protein
MNFDLQLQSYYLERFVLNIAIATLEQGGSTAKLDTLQILPPSDTWSFPKYPGKTVILPLQVNLIRELKAFISTNDTFLRESGCFLGTWINPQSQHYYFDIIIRCNDLTEAKRLALELSQKEGRKIVALYNSERREIIYL